MNKIFRLVVALCAAVSLIRCGGTETSVSRLQSVRPLQITSGTRLRTEKRVRVPSYFVWSPTAGVGGRAKLYVELGRSDRFLLASGTESGCRWSSRRHTHAGGELPRGRHDE